MKAVSVKQMKELESQADQGGLSYEQMMANAGLGLAQVVQRRYFRRPSCKVLGLVGSGNNGGDTLVALKYLAGWGWQTKAYLVKKREADDALVEAYLQAGGEIHQADQLTVSPICRGWCSRVICCWMAFWGQVSVCH
jgi:NAD(P)H-hydrate epimerase